MPLASWDRGAPRTQVLNHTFWVGQFVGRQQKNLTKMADVFLFVFQGILEDPGILYQKNAIWYAQMAMEEIQDVYIDVYAITLYSL